MTRRCCTGTTAFKPGYHPAVTSNTTKTPSKLYCARSKEETGLDVELVPTQHVPEISNLDQVPAPRTILVEDVYDQKVGAHQHIDMIYFCRVSGPRPPAPDGWVWFTRKDLAEKRVMASRGGNHEAPPEDVITLGLEGIALSRVEQLGK